MNFVLIGSFCAASSNASFATCFGNTIAFENDTSWFYYSSPIFRVTFTFTHPHFSGLR